MVLLKESENDALLEPIPLRTRKKPPVIPDRVDLQRRDALFYIEDVYAGPGLEGVPRGTVKQLRLFTYHFAYQRLAGIYHRVGADGPWEPKRPNWFRCSRRVTTASNLTARLGIG